MNTCETCKYWIPEGYTRTHSDGTTYFEEDRYPTKKGYKVCKKIEDGRYSTETAFIGNGGHEESAILLTSGDFGCSVWAEKTTLMEEINHQELMCKFHVQG